MTSVYDLASRGKPLTLSQMDYSLQAAAAAAPLLYSATRPTSLPLGFPALVRPIPGGLHVPQPTKRSTGFSIEDILNHKATKVPSPVENCPPAFTKLCPTELKCGFPTTFLTSPTRPFFRFTGKRFYSSVSVLFALCFKLYFPCEIHRKNFTDNIER